MCEDTVGYSGTYDPHYAYSPSGALFATSFYGIKIQRDACTFGATPAGTTFASAGLLGPDHAYYYTASQAADATTTADFKIYKSAMTG